ncbi:MAG: molecular chaperone [Thermoplasmata archaeon]
MVEWDGEGLARLRHELYRFFATSLLYPEEERLALLTDAANLVGEGQLAVFAFHQSWERLTQSLQKRMRLDDLEKEHVRLFSVGPGGALCPPHESFYLALPGQATALIVNQVEREYTRLGLTIPPHMKSLPDHVSAEMDAMAFLCGKEAEAWRGEALHEAVQVLEEEGDFLRQHLGRWFPFFAERVLGIGEETFYATVVGAADAFIKHDIDLLNILMKRVKGHD